jgi:hypothetical protein
VLISFIDLGLQNFFEAFSRLCHSVSARLKISDPVTESSSMKCEFGDTAVLVVPAR